MPRKPSPKKKNGPAAARKQTKTPPAKRSANARAAPPTAAFYVTVSPPRVAIVREKPARNGATGPCPTFEQAKAAAIDALVAAIEDAERQLARCKRANSVDELRTA